MSFNIRAIASEQEAEAMVAADSFCAIVERLQRMVTAGRRMILAVREYTYTGRPPVLHAGLRLDSDAQSGGFQVDCQAAHVSCVVRLTNGGDGFHDTRWLGFLEDVYEHSGNLTEAEAWKRYREHEAEHSDHFKRRRDMTHVAFVGGLPGWKWQNADRITITGWNRDGVATERVLGFDPGEGSW